MPSPYSYDLRQKVIKAIDGGMSKAQVSSIFKISRNTIKTWLHRIRKTGDIVALTGYQIRLRTISEHLSRLMAVKLIPK